MCHLWHSLGLMLWLDCQIQRPLLALSAKMNKGIERCRAMHGLRFLLAPKLSRLLAKVAHTAQVDPLQLVKRENLDEYL